MVLRSRFGIVTSATFAFSGHGRRGPALATETGERSQVMDAREVADALGVSRWTVWDWAKANRLPIKTFRIGKGYRFSRAELERYLTTGEPSNPAYGRDDR